MKNDNYIIDGLRLPIGKANGRYKNILPEVFTAYLLKYFPLKYPFLHDNLDEIILGNAFGTGGNMARYALLEAGFKSEIPATTIDMQCGSGLKSIILADGILRGGNGHCILAGGMESNSLAPKRQYHRRDSRFIDTETNFTQATFAPPQFEDTDMKKAAENVAKLYHISKDEMMLWTVESHEKAIKSYDIQYFTNIIASSFDTHMLIFDQAVKRDLTLEILKKTQTTHLIDHTNTAHLHDGAAIVLMANETFCVKNNVTPKYKIVATTVAGGLPNLSPLGVVWATEKLLKQQNISINNIDLFEINESFAVKPLVFIKHFNVEAEKVNTFGGNLAYGHPFGASGTINLIHLMQAMAFKNGRFGLVAVGVAGGLGAAVLIERI